MSIGKHFAVFAPSKFNYCETDLRFNILTDNKDRDKMKDNVYIDSEYFQLSLNIERFDNDAQVLLHVNVTSDAVSAKADMDVSINDYEKFLENMQQMHQNLRGEAIIAEPYGDKQFLKFTMDDHTGHVYVKGELVSRYNGHIQYLSIENEFDQSSLSCIRDN